MLDFARYFLSVSNLFFVSARSAEIAIVFSKKFFKWPWHQAKHQIGTGQKLSAKSIVFSISSLCFVSARAEGITMFCFSYIVFGGPGTTRKKFLKPQIVLSKIPHPGKKRGTCVKYGYLFKNHHHFRQVLLYMHKKEAPRRGAICLLFLGLVCMCFSICTFLGLCQHTRSTDTQIYFRFGPVLLGHLLFVCGDVASGQSCKARSGCTWH